MDDHVVRRSVMPFADDRFHCRLGMAIPAREGVAREAALGLGKTIAFGGIAAIAAVHGHQLLACELSQAPKPLTVAAPVATIERKAARSAASFPPILRLERHTPVYSSPFPSRRLILQ